MGFQIIFDESAAATAVNYVNNINRIDEERRQHGVDTAYNYKALETKSKLHGDTLASQERIATGRNETDVIISDRANAVARDQADKDFQVRMRTLDINEDSLLYGRAKERVKMFQKTGNTLSEEATYAEDHAVQYLNEQGHNIAVGDKSAWGPETHKLVNARIDEIKPGLRDAITDYENAAGDFTFITKRPTNGEAAGTVTGADPATVKSHTTAVGAVTSHKDENGNDVLVTDDGTPVQEGGSPQLRSPSEQMEVAMRTGDFGLAPAPVFVQRDINKDQQLAEKLLEEQKAEDAGKPVSKDQKSSTDQIVSQALGVGQSPEQWTNNFNTARLEMRQRRDAANRGIDAEAAAEQTELDRQWQNSAEAERGTVGNEGLGILKENNFDARPLWGQRDHAREAPLMPDYTAAGGTTQEQFAAPFSDTGNRTLEGNAQLNARRGTTLNSQEAAGGVILSQDPNTRGLQQQAHQAAVLRETYADSGKPVLDEQGNPTGQRTVYTTPTNRQYAAADYATQIAKRIKAGYYTGGRNAQNTEKDVREALLEQGVDPEDSGAVSNYVTEQFQINPKAYTKGIKGIEGKTWGQMSTREKDLVTTQILATASSRRRENMGFIRNTATNAWRDLSGLVVNRSNDRLPLTGSVDDGTHRAIAGRGEEGVTGGTNRSHYVQPVPDDDPLVQGLRRQPLYINNR